MSRICNSCGKKLEGIVYRVKLPGFDYALFACNESCRARLEDALLPSRIEKHGGTFLAEIDHSIIRCMYAVKR